MGTITKRGKSFRVLIRKGGHYECETFDTLAQAKSWEKRIESEIAELRAAGILQPKGLTLGGLIDRYTEEFYPQKQWGRSKSADLARLKKDIGSIAADKLNASHITKYFRDRRSDGAGPVTIASQITYLIGVLKVARTLWHLDVPLQAAQDARTALASVGLVGKSTRRDRRVTDAEIAQLIDYFEKNKTMVPYPELIRFAVATGMRISEICRLQWKDLNERDRTIIIRDRKHPQDRLGNDQLVPLLNVTGFDAFAIVQRQPRGGTRIFPYSAKTVCSVFPRQLEKLGLEDLHLHDLRHEAISRLFEAGYRIEQVALVSGHRDWSMLKRYTHVRATDLHRKENRQ
jgi:integrase